MKNIYPKYKFINFVADKCLYYNFFNKNKINVAPTKCYNLKLKTQNIIKNLKKRDWNHIFVKPTPSAESKQLYNIYKNNLNQAHFSNHLEQLKTGKYNKIVTQEYINSLATEKYPELRTFWVGNKYQYTIETVDKGYEWKIRKNKLPKKIIEQSKKIIKLMESKFKLPIIVSRIDYGYNKSKNKYFVNEYEYAPGTFAEIFPKNKWIMDAAIAEKILNIISKNI